MTSQRNTYGITGTLLSINSQQRVVSTPRGSVTLDPASGCSVTLNGSKSSLSPPAAGDLVNLTVDSSTDQVTAIPVSAALPDTGTIARDTYRVAGTLSSVHGQQIVLLAPTGSMTLNDPPGDRHGKG